MTETKPPWFKRNAQWISGALFGFVAVQMASQPSENLRLILVFPLFALFILGLMSVRWLYRDQIMKKLDDIQTQLDHKDERKRHAPFN